MKTNKRIYISGVDFLFGLSIAALLTVVFLQADHPLQQAFTVLPN
jgi:hypothetical protein